MLVKQRRGFTLIELMVTLSITAVLLSLAAPSFKVILANAQIRTGAQGLLDGMQFARVEAIRLNERVIFNKDTQTAWTVKLESSGLVLQTRAYTEGSNAAEVSVTPSGANRLTFDGLGRVKTNTDASSSLSQLDINLPTGFIPAANMKQLRITASGGGALRLCDPQATAGVGRGC